MGAVSSSSMRSIGGGNVYDANVTAITTNLGTALIRDISPHSVGEGPNAFCSRLSSVANACSVLQR